MAARKSAPKGASDFAPFSDVSAFGDIPAFADAARENYETALKTFSDNAEKFRVQTEESLASTREGFEAAGERMRAMGADALTHVREDVTEAVDFANELARAKSVNDALELQRAYWTRLFETRVERARAYTEASVEASRSAFEPLNKSFASAFSFAPAFDKFFPFASK